MPNFSPDDAAFMRRALALAARGQGRVEPNPMVGCVVVRGGQIVGEGFHRRFGGAHAEVEALRRAGERARGATAYVTLEPCCHFGKTPPCTRALLDAGVARVVAALQDPNPLVHGRGLAELRRGGAAVQLGLLQDDAAELNAPFLKLQRSGRPWVIAKWAQSLDGKIATRTGHSRWISDAAARAHAHRVRGRVDAILVGVGTVLRDDPLLTCRAARPRRVATRVVLDPLLRTPLSARLVRTVHRAPTWIICGTTASRRKRQALLAAGCALHTAPVSSGRVRLAAVLDLLGRSAMTNVLVEGGGRVLGAFADQRLVDEVQVYLAPRLIGGAAAIGPLHGRGAARVPDALALRDAACRALGGGWFISARLAPRN